MHRILLKKSLHDTKLLFACCGLWLFAFCWLRVWIVSRLERGRFQAILEQLGDVVSTFSPVPLAHLLSFTGRIAVGYDEGLVVLVLIAFAITRASDVVSGELNRGTLEMLLAQPVARWQIVASQGCVTVVGLALLTMITWLGLYTGIHSTQAKIEHQPSLEIIPGLSMPVPFTKPAIEKVPMHTQVNTRHFLPAAVNLFCLGFCFAGVVSLLSACDRYRWRTVGISIVWLVSQMVLKILGVVRKDWPWLQYTSIFNAYEPQKFVELAVNQPDAVWCWHMASTGNAWRYGPLSCYALLLALGLLGYLLAILVFTKRDIPAPL